MCTFIKFKDPTCADNVGKSDLEGKGKGIGKGEEDLFFQTKPENSFDAFWKAFNDPGKRGKKPALKAWIKINPDDALADEIISGAKLYRKMCVAEKREQTFCKMPQGWLANGLWKDGVEIKKSRLSEDSDHMSEQKEDEF